MCIFNIFRKKKKEKCTPLEYKDVYELTQKKQTEEFDKKICEIEKSILRNINRGLDYDYPDVGSHIIDRVYNYFKEKGYRVDKRQSYIRIFWGKN
jgi:hypothetical protein